MFFDVHTHKSAPLGGFGIRNLPFVEIEAVLATAEQEFFSIGLHPWEVADSTNEAMYVLEKWARDKRIVAIGECGLDKNSKASVALQLDVFGKQIALSEVVQKPVIVHCVGCFNELFELKKQLNPTQPWIIHGFRSKLQLAEQALRMGCYLSFGQRFNADAVRVTPVDKLFVETDESNMTIREIYQLVADAKCCSPEILSAGAQLFGQIASTK